MIRKYLYLALLASSLALCSFLLQSSVFKPQTTLEKAANFELVSTEFCVTGETNFGYSIRVEAGDLDRGSAGSLSSRTTAFSQGDCLAGLIQLSPAKEHERYAFRGKLKSITGSIAHSQSLEYLNSVRKYMTGFDGEAANLVAGLAVGIDGGLSDQFKENMKTTGLTHLTAVSGANCAIVLALVWLTLKRFKLGRGVRTVLALMTLTAYVALVGWQPSVLRSAFMMATVFVCLELGRRIWLPGALALGSTVLLVIDPWLILDYGFWLSILATYGLVTLTPALSEKLQARMPKWLALILAATVAAQLWCLPILIQLQGGVTTHSVLANLLVEPMVYLITVLGLLAGLIGGLSPLMALPFLEVAKLPASWIVYVANTLAGAPFGLLKVPGGIIGVLLAAVFVVSLTASFKKKTSKSLPLGLLGIWVIYLSFGISQQVSFAVKPWQIVACDVGQGDALLLRSEGEIAVVDVGKDGRLINDCLNQMGVNHISLLVITHFDQDHVGGLSGALQGRTIDSVLVSAFPDPRPQAIAMLQVLDNATENLMVGNLHQKGELGGFTWEVISSLGELGVSANEASLGVSFLSPDLNVFTLGDLNERAQEMITFSFQDTDLPTVVKVSHHGSADQSEDFYKRIGADVALISVGESNSYGHPTSRALRILENAGSRVFRTDRDGAISLQAINGAIEVVTAGAG